MLDDQHVRPTQLPLEVLRWSLAARLAGAELVFLSVGAGPIDQVWSRRFLKTAVALAHEVSYRDSRSKDFMASIGRDVGSDRVLPDLALSRAARRRPAPRRPRGPSRWGYCRASTGQRAPMDIDATRTTSSSSPKSNRGGRRARSHRHRRRGRRGYARRHHATASLDGTVGGGRRMPLVLGRRSDRVDVRRHGRLSLSQPGCGCDRRDTDSLPLAYGPKNDALLEQFEMPSWGHDIDSFSVEVVMSNVREASRRPRMSRDTLEGYRQSIRDRIDHLIIY